MKTLTLFLGLCFHFYCVSGKHSTEESALKERASSASFSPLEQGLRLKTKKQFSDALSVKKIPTVDEKQSIVVEEGESEEGGRARESKSPATREVYQIRNKISDSDTNQDVDLEEFKAWFSDKNKEPQTFLRLFLLLFIRARPLLR